jgi:hypothetical protein
MLPLSLGREFDPQLSGKLDTNSNQVTQIKSLPEKQFFYRAFSGASK